MAESIAFKHSPWRLVVDKESGAWQSLEWNGKAISENPSSGEPFNWGPGWQTSKKEGKCALVSHKWDEQGGKLTLSYQSGQWNIDETLAFGALGRADRICISICLTYNPPNPNGSPAKFSDVFINTFIPKKGRYLCPAKKKFSVSESEGELSELLDGEVKLTAWGILPFFVENGKHTVIFMPDARTDNAFLSFQADGNSICVKSQAKACGWAYPGESQVFGPFYLEVFPGNAKSALKEGVWRLYDDMGLKVPADTPDWVRDAVLYSFHPGGTVGSNWTDLGGFAAARDELLPQIAKLGIDAIWMLPLEDKAPYWPRDYYKFAEGLGSHDDYASLVDKAHGYGMKVWQDNVPHGGTPAFGALRGNKPWQLVFDENGDALSYWCFDFGNPEWQRYIADVAEHYMRKYKLDGYRIDACGHSKIPNWRKKDFPSIEKTPKNVPEAWWKTELAAVGGKLPPMPYGRASMTERKGGLELIRAVRNAVKRCNPENGAVLGEVQYAPYMQELDVVYDLDFVYMMVPQMKSSAPELFATRLARWLEEQKFSEPRGTIRLRYVDTHDTLRARGLLGANGAKAMTALSMLIHGLPMIYHDSEVGQGFFLKKLIDIRKALPELRRGDAEYQTEDPKCVFSCVRRLDGLASMSLINFSPNAVKAKASLPSLPLDLTKGRISAWDCADGSIVASGSPVALKSFLADLKPWESKVIAFRPADAPCPVPVTSAPPRVTPTEAGARKVSIAEGQDEIEISAPSYKLTIGKADGLPHALLDSGGKRLLEEAAIVMDPIFDKEPLRPSNAKLEIESSNASARLKASFSLPSGAKVNLLYNFLQDSVKIDASLEGQDASRQIGLVFGSKDVERWQVNSAEGLLDDFFGVRHEKGVPSNAGNIYYRTQGTPMLWQAKNAPLSLAKPALTALHKGHGFEIALENQLAGGLDNAMVLSRLGKERYWHAAFFWRDADPWEKPASGRAERFSLAIRPLSEPLAEPKAQEAVKAGGVTLKNESTGWRVENSHYSLSVSRTGGVIDSLRSKPSDMELMSGSDLYTNRGFFKKGRKEFRASACNDVESGVRIWSNGDKLHMLFSGMLRGADRFEKLSPPVWFSTEYVFDSSPTFNVAWSVCCEGSPTADDAFLSWSASSPLWSKIMLSKNGKEIASGSFGGADRDSETAKLPSKQLPDTAFIYGKDGKELLALKNIKAPLATPIQNVFVKGSSLFFALLDKKASDIQPGKWNETSISVSLGSKAQRDSRSSTREK